MNANLSDLMRALQGLRGTSPILALMSDDQRLPDAIDAVGWLPSGSLVIVRHRDSGYRRTQAERLLPVCRRRGVSLLIANDARLAHMLRADGVHLSEAELKARPRRPDYGRADWIVTAAAHNAIAIRRAAQAGADAVLLSPVLPTDSHPGGNSLGPCRFAGLVHRAGTPVLALGGITAQTVRRVRHSGATGVAGIGFGITQ